MDRLWTMVTDETVAGDTLANAVFVFVWAFYVRYLKYWIPRSYGWICRRVTERVDNKRVLFFDPGSGNKPPPLELLNEGLNKQAGPNPTSISITTVVFADTTDTEKNQLTQKGNDHDPMTSISIGSKCPQNGDIERPRLEPWQRRPLHYFLVSVRCFIIRFILLNYVGQCNCLYWMNSISIYLPMFYVPFRYDNFDDDPRPRSNSPGVIILAVVLFLFPLYCLYSINAMYQDIISFKPIIVIVKDNNSQKVIVESLSTNILFIYSVLMCTIISENRIMSFQNFKSFLLIGYIILLRKLVKQVLVCKQRVLLFYFLLLK